MLLAGAGVLAAGAVTGCGLTKSEDSSAASTADAGESALARIKKDKKVRFGVDLSFQPLQYRDPKTKEPTGYSIEVTKLLATALGAKPEWVEVPFQELIAAQKAGRFDMVGIPVVNTAERALEVAFASAPAFLEGTYLFQRRGLGLKSIDQLNDGSKTIALLAGSAQVNTAKLLFPKAKRKELPDDVAATADVSTGRSDALFIGDYAVGDARRKGLELIQSRPVATAWNTYFLPQGDIPLQQFVTTFLQQKASDLTLANLWKQFVADEIERYGVQSAPVKDPYLAAAYS
jgi:ABC-type amino acid transport substrate-binding protein